MHGHFALHQANKNLVKQLIAYTQALLIFLTCGKLCRRRLVNHMLRNRFHLPRRPRLLVHPFGQLENVRFIQAAKGRIRARRIAIQRGVAHHRFALVTGVHHHPTILVRQRHKNNHAAARLGVFRRKPCEFFAIHLTKLLFKREKWLFD